MTNFTLVAVSFVATVIFFLSYAMFRREKALAFLSQDWLGLAPLAIGALAIFVGGFLAGNWSVVSLVFGGILLGLGFLIILPEGLTKVLLHPVSLGVLTIVSGIWVLVFYTIIPILPTLYKAVNEIIAGFGKAIAIMINDGAMSQVVAFVGFIVLSLIGGLIIFFSRKVKK